MKVNGHLCALATLFLGKSCQYPVDRGLGGPQSQSGCGNKEKQSPFIACARNRTLVIYPIA